MSERSGAGVRAIDHVGVTVPDIEEAARFFADALGAETALRDDAVPARDATKAHDFEQAQLGTRPGTRWRRAADAAPRRRTRASSCSTTRTRTAGPP